MADGTGGLGDTLIPAINRIQDIFSQVGSSRSLYASGPVLTSFLRICSQFRLYLEDTQRHTEQAIL